MAVKLAAVSTACHLRFMSLSAIGAFLRRHDPDRFLTALFAPPNRREALFALYAFNHELARAREVASQPILALIRLQWWREVVDGADKRHEVADPLRAAIAAGLLDRAGLLAMIAARETEADEAVPNLESWRGYVEGAYGGLAGAAGRLLGADDTEMKRLAALGAAYGCVGQVLGMARLAAADRCLLPDDVLARHGLVREGVIRAPETAAPVLAELAQEGEAYLRLGSGRFRREVVAAALPAVLAKRDLRRRARLRGIGDRLAVTLAALTGRI